MERQPKVGDKIVLLINRGDGKKGDILTINYVHIENNTMKTKEFWDVETQSEHSMYIIWPYGDHREWDFADNIESNYQIY